MISTLSLTLILYLLTGSSSPATGVDQTEKPAQSARIEARYDAAKGRTTVKLGPFQVSGENGKYQSLQLAVSYNYPGQLKSAPEMLAFELLSVVKARQLKIDLYVVLFVDGEKIFLSSTRSAIRNPIPGRPWVGERIVLRMPYATFLRITNAKDVEIGMDAVRFVMGESQLQALRAFGSYIIAD